MRLFFIFACFSFSLSIFGQGDKKTKDTPPPKDLMPLFQQVLNDVEANYVEEVNKEKLMEAAIGGMLSSLDPHCAYINPKDYIEFNESAKGEIIGIGMEFIMENGLIKVIAPIEDAPAAVAGLKSGDYIFKINGEAVLRMTTDEAVKKLRGGPIGSEVKVNIYRPGKDPIEMKIKRDVIKVKTVKHRIEDQVGYIRISSFMNEKTIDMVKEAIDSFKKTLKDKFQGIVIDLRNNAGGRIEQAVGLCNLFLDNVEIVSTRGRDSGKVEHYMANSGQYVDSKMPVVVLINGGSASASEITAGALQDHKRAIIMGTKSFGKASVQAVKPVMGDRAIKYTIARYYTPLGRSIQAQGIEPDLIADYIKFEKISDEERFREKDYKGALKPDQGLTEILKEKDKVKKPGDKDGKDKKEAVKPEDQDYPLVRAFELVKSLSVYSKIFTPAPVADKVLSGTDVTKIVTQKDTNEVAPVIASVVDADWKKHITPFENPDKKPTISIILHSLGLKQDLVDKSIAETSKYVTLAFNPHSPNLKDLCKKSRDKNHEVLVVLPLEPNGYPKEDPGPKTLLTRQTDEENLLRFNWVISQGDSFVGLLNNAGGRFSTVEKSVNLLIQGLNEKKIPYIDGTPTETSKAVGSKITVPYSFIDNEILEDASQEEVENAFKNALSLAKSKGHVTMMMTPGPFVLKKLIELDEKFKSEGVLLAPISYVLLKKKD